MQDLRLLPVEIFHQILVTYQTIGGGDIINVFSFIELFERERDYDANPFLLQELSVGMLPMLSPFELISTLEK